MCNFASGVIALLFISIDGAAVVMDSSKGAAAAATLPKEFTGVWIAADDTQNECKRQDWKGVAASESDRLINITAKAREEWESGCTIKSVKTSSDSESMLEW